LTVALTFLALGITTQVILLDTGISLTRAWVASAVIYSATSQFAYLAVVQAGGSELAAIVAGWIVASRFGILAVAIARVFQRGVAVRAVAAVHAFDINVGLGLQQVDQERAKKAFWAATAAMMVGWFTGITAGTLLGDVMGDTERFGIDALFPAALLAIVGNALRSRNGLIAGVSGALICGTLIPFAPAGLPIILSVTGVAAAIGWERRDPV
jgi:predicted branched-subunit amino acid permease